MSVKEESGKVGLKLSIKKTKIMASCPITSWQIEGGKVETVADFILFSDFIYFLKSLWTVTAVTKVEDTCSLKENL